VMEPERLYESPFTDINPQGPEGVFPSAKVDQTVKVLAEIRQRAAAKSYRVEVLSSEATANTCALCFSLRVA
jgi:hypothetical protein